MDAQEFADEFNGEVGKVYADVDGMISEVVAVRHQVVRGEEALVIKISDTVVENN